MIVELLVMVYKVIKIDLLIYPKQSLIEIRENFLKCSDLVLIYYIEKEVDFLRCIR